MNDFFAFVLLRMFCGISYANALLDAVKHCFAC